jgi:hypothetical protein
VKYVLVAITALALGAASCTADETTTTEAVQGDNAKSNPEWFRCEAAPGSYHQLIIVEHEDTDDDPSDDDKLVRILFGASDSGQFGRCRLQASPGSNANQFFCRSSSQSLRMTWPTAETKAKAMVQVEEDWLFGVRRYQTKCAPVK